MVLPKSNEEVGAMNGRLKSTSVSRRESARDVTLSPDSDVTRETEAIERGLRSMSWRISRRSFAVKVGKAILTALGLSIVPVLPVDRQSYASSSDCYAWYMCGIGAMRVCSCACGVSGDGPCPGTTQQGGSWFACCFSTYYNKSYGVTYKDCCGYNSCCPDQNLNNACNCKPYDRPNWCNGAGGNYICCTKVAIGNQC